MKQVITLFAGCILMVVISCKKNNNNSSSSSPYISYSISGTNTLINNDITAKVETNSGSYPELDIMGYNGNHSISIHLVMVFSSGKLQAGTFPVDYSNAETGTIIITYITLRGTPTYASGGQASYAPGYNQTGNITITQLTSNHVSGSFQGILDLLGEGNDIQTKNVTNGKFSLNY